MEYKIITTEGLCIPSDVELVHDNPKSLDEALRELSRLFPKIECAVCRDGAPVSRADRFADLKSYEINQAREAESQLPSTHRRGTGAPSDEITIAPDGNPTSVWGPDNPEDRFD